MTPEAEGDIVLSGMCYAAAEAVGAPVTADRQIGPTFGEALANHHAGLPQPPEVHAALKRLAVVVNVTPPPTKTFRAIYRRVQLGRGGPATNSPQHRVRVGGRGRRRGLARRARRTSNTSGTSSGDDGPGEPGDLPGHLAPAGGAR